MILSGDATSQNKDSVMINHRYHLPLSVKKHEIPEKDKKVWVNQPTSDTGKRFCSLNICFRPVGEQPRISVIFLGQ